MLEETVSFSEFKGFYENKLLEFPENLDSAFTVASTSRINRHDNKIQRADIFVTNGRAGRGNEGRGKPSQNTNVIRPICFNHTCGQRFKKDVCQNRSSASSLVSWQKRFKFQVAATISSSDNFSNNLFARHKFDDHQNSKILKS